MPTSFKQDKYELGSSTGTGTLDPDNREVKLDVSLTANPNLVTNGGAIYGKVAKQNGDPINLAVVQITDKNYGLIGHTFTASDGSYTLSPIAPTGTGESYILLATASGYILDEVDSITLSSKGETNQNFTLTANPNPQQGIIVGVVSDLTTSAAVSGAGVNLYTVDELGVETPYGITFTNSVGQFVFNELEPGDYKIRTGALSYDTNVSTKETLSSGAILPVTISLTEDTATSQGTVSGIISDTNGPISGADVVLYEVGTGNSLTAVAFSKTDSNGAYVFVVDSTKTYEVVSNQGA